MSLAFDKAGWLQPASSVVHAPTVRTCALVVERPLAIVWHGTGGTCRNGMAERMVRRIQTYRRGLDRSASWHFLVGVDGSIFQSAPLTVGTWHVGRPALIGGRPFRNVNAATVGIELENPGRLLEMHGRFYCWPFFSNPTAPRSERRPDPRCEVPSALALAVSGGAWWSTFPKVQESAATRLMDAIAGALERPRAACAYTHRQLDPARKEDPGRLFEETVLPRMLDLVFGPDDDATLVTPPQVRLGKVAARG
jgi:hypothetical protein